MRNALSRGRTEWRRLVAGPFMGPVLTLVTGSALAQAVTLGARPVLTRVYTPEEFGALTLFLTAVALADTVSSGRYSDAVMLPAEEPRAANLLALSAGLVGGGAVLAGLLAWAAGAWGPFGLEGVSPLAVAGMATAAVAASGWLFASVRWQTRRGRFRVVSAGRFAHSLTAVGVQLTAGLLAAGAVGLVGGAVLGLCAGAAVTGGGLLLRDGRRIAAYVRGSEVRVVAVRYVRFPRYAMPAALLKGLAGRAAVLALTPFGPAALGLYGVAYGSLALPLDLTTSAVGEVFFARAAEARRAGTLGALTAATLRRLVALVAYPCAAAAAVGPALFALVFGEPWREAGVYAQALAPWVLLTAVAVPLTGLFDVLERQREDLAVAAALLAGQVAGIVGGGVLGGALGAVIGVSAAGVALRLLHLRWMLRLAGASPSRALRDGTAYVALAAAAVAPVLLARALGAGPGWLLVAAALGGAAYYAAAGWRERG